MARPFIDLAINVPWYINCTPGGRMFHIQQEIAAYSGSIEHCVLWCGTNNLCHGSAKIDEPLIQLIDEAKRKFRR